MSYQAGDQIAIQRLVFSLLDDDGDAVRVPLERAEDGYVTIGFKAFSTSPGAVADSPSGDGSTPVEMIDGILTALPATGCEYRAWGALEEVRAAIGTTLLTHELVHFMLRYCVPVLNAVKQHWICVCLRMMFGKGVPHMCELGIYADDGHGFY